MRLSRRHFVRLGAGILGYTALAACSGATTPAAPQEAEPTSAAATQPPAAPPAATEIQLVHWVHPLGDDEIKFQGLMDRFHATYPEIQISIEIVPWQGRIERKMSAAAAGTSPDISYLNVDEFTTYVVEGALASLDEYITPEDLDDLLPGPRNATDWEGHLYEMPVLYAFRVAYYNREIWETVGLDPDWSPITWQELEETFGTLKEAKESGQIEAWPFALEGLSTGAQILRNFNPWFYQSGGKLLREDGRSGFDTDAGIEAMTWASHLFDNYVNPADIGSNGADVRDRFGRADIAYDHNNELHVIKLMQQDYPDLDFWVGHTQQNQRRWTHGGVGCYGIWMASKNKDAAWKWIDFLTRDGNLEYQEKFGFVPPRQSLFAEYQQGAEPIYQAALEEAQYGNVEKHPRLWDIWAVIDPAIQAVYGHVMTPEEAIQDAVEKINRDVLGLA
ncbi:MAG: sugar ABC transporter substrate-binding protein [Anaerolineae bacterium]|nr:sugar ABC transporter substrate-binding protein [Anaerolineae bacterium]